MTERFVSKFSQLHEFVSVAPRLSATAAIVSYVVVYLMAGWVLGGHVGRAR